MINLFKKVYVNYDTDMRCGKTQKRIFATDREYPYPVSQDPVTQKVMGILGHHGSADAFLETHGGLEGTIEMLFISQDKICLIATHELATLLSMSVFKSIVKDPTVESAYTFYRAMYMHERAMSVQNITDFDNSLAFKGAMDPMYTVEQFQPVFDKAIACECLKAIKPADLPIEYLMAHYFIDPTTRSKNIMAFLNKYRAIALENAIFRIRVARATILNNSIPVSEFLGREVDEIHAVDELIADPRTSWLADTSLGLYSEEDPARKYSLSKLLKIYDSIEQLLRGKMEERVVLQYIGAGDIAGLVELDTQDQLGNFIGTESFVSKVNGVFINRCYQAWRKSDKAFFQQFALIGG